MNGSAEWLENTVEFGAVPQRYIVEIKLVFLQYV